MARIELTDDTLTLRLSPLEKLGALRGDVVVPREAVRRVQRSEAGWREVKGVRAPGTAFPGLINLGTYRRGRGRKDFAAVYGRQRPVVVVDLDPQHAAFDRLVMSTDEPGELLRLLTPPDEEGGATAGTAGRAS